MPYGAIEIRSHRCSPCERTQAVAIPDIPSLHDAVLLPLHVDWSARTVEMMFKNVEGVSAAFPDASFTDVSVVAHGVTELQLEARHPWGPSTYVNDTKCTELRTGELCLRVEMQSGDPIEIIATRYELTSVPASEPPSGNSRLPIGT